MICHKQDYPLYMYIYILPIACLSIAFDARMFSHNGYGPGTRTQELPGRDLGELWVLGPGPGPISIMATHVCVEGNQ